jgi:hypothetical protein
MKTILLGVGAVTVMFIILVMIWKSATPPQPEKPKIEGKINMYISP